MTERRSLFDGASVVGVFRGFSQGGGLEFHAVLSIPFKETFQSMPMHGQFVIVRLEKETEAILGRIISVAADSAPQGSGKPKEEDEDGPPGKTVKYRVSIRMLGVLKISEGKVVFAASHRRLPHIGSPVAFLSDWLLREVSGHHHKGAEIGFLAMGEFVYAGNDKRLSRSRYPWMHILEPAVIPRFDASHMVARKTFVLARAGFGKSNNVKLLFSSLYSGEPTMARRDGRKIPVGTVLFDPEGEYFWPDADGRPGFCDIPGVSEKTVVFTDREGPSPYYGSFVAGGVRLDIRRMKAADVLGVALPPEKQEHSNVRKLKSLTQASWETLVDEVHRHGYHAREELFMDALNLKENQEAEILAARSNMVLTVQMLHDPGSPMLDMLFAALSEGKLCVVDLSRMRGVSGLCLSGLVLHSIFTHNSEENTKADSKAIPTITVIEEAQSVLGSGGSSGEGPYITWTKEGRKFGCGVVAITQQPGSIPNEILSQGDNWFIFHLLSAGDLGALKKANAHFSDDLLSSLLNEPLHGHGVFWSSATGKAFPVPIRTMLFEEMYEPADPEYKRPAADTYAARLKNRAESLVKEAKKRAVDPQGLNEPDEDGWESPPVDLDAVRREREANRPGTGGYDAAVRAAIETLKTNHALLAQIHATGVPWARVTAALEEAMPEGLHDRRNTAYSIVPKAMDEIFGGDGWTKERRNRASGEGTTTYVMLTPRGKKKGGGKTGKN